MQRLIDPTEARVSVSAAYLGMLTLAALTVAVVLSGSSSEYRGLEAAARVLVVTAPMAVGFFALRRPPFARFGALLVASGPALFLATLANSDNATLYSIGRVSGWAVEPLLIYLMLAFPTGRLENRVDRVLFGSMSFVALTLYLPTALMVESYPVPAPWASCVSDCPPNAFMLLNAEPAFVEDIVRPLREFALVAITAAVAVRLYQRIAGARPLIRRGLAPVLGVACFRLGAFAIALFGRRVAPESDAIQVASWLLALAVPLMAFAFLAGFVLWWVFIARATQQLAVRLRGHPKPEELRTALADAFNDPQLEIVYWIGNGEQRWGDAEGHSIPQPMIGPDRCLTEVRDGSDLVAGIVHDAALEEDAGFISAATAYVLITLDNHRLSAQASSLLREVRDSRARIQAAADDERRRIERDLHDGAQQRLVALRIKLELAAERTDGGQGQGSAALRELGSEVEEALDEIRALAHGIYPPALADRGLVQGLRAAALRNPLPTTVFAAGIGRYSLEIESAAYFFCLEAVQNIAKHADGASAAVIELSDNGSLRVEVRDDGAGFDVSKVRGGMGFTSMRDRLGAVGGELKISSSPGRGTRLEAKIPLTPT